MIVPPETNFTRVWSCVNGTSFSPALSEIPLSKHNAICVTGKALLRNYFTEDAAKLLNRQLQNISTASEETENFVHVLDLLEIEYRRDFMFCKGIENCNKFTNLETCEKIWQMYNETADNNYFALPLRAFYLGLGLVSLAAFLT